MKVTKVQAKSSFVEVWNEAVAYNQNLAKDKIAKREAWNNFTDSLCKDNMITENQYRNWTNPF